MSLGLKVRLYLEKKKVGRCVCLELKTHYKAMPTTMVLYDCNRSYTDLWMELRA